MKSRIDRFLFSSTLTLLAGAIAAAAACSDSSDRMRIHVAVAIARADLVFKGRVQSVRAPVLNPTGHYTGRQFVEYAIEAVLLGELSVGDIVVVDHMIVQNSRTAEPGEKELSRSLFRKGDMLLVIARFQMDRFWSTDEDYGTLEPTPENEDLIRQAILKRGNAR